MAANTISGNYGFVTQIPAILKEGNITVNTSAYGPFGKMQVCTFATEISKGDVVALSADAGNTADATENNIVVCPLAANADLAIGRIIDEPKWVRQPSANQAVWATMLAGGYYRVATVELFIPMSIFKATLVTADASAITPGTTGNLDIDASASLALHGLSVVDVAQNGSADMIPLTYAAKAAGATVTVLVGFKGFGTVTA